MPLTCDCLHLSYQFDLVLFASDETETLFVPWVKVTLKVGAWCTENFRCCIVLLLAALTALGCSRASRRACGTLKRRFVVWRSPAG